MNKQITDAETKMDSKHVKGRAAMLVIQTMQIQMILCYSFKPPDQQKLIILMILSVDKEEEQGEPSYAKQQEFNQGNHFGIQFSIEVEHDIRPSNFISM